MEKISEAKAARLLEDENYVSDLQLYQESFDKAKDILEETNGWPERKFTPEDWKAVEDFHDSFRNAVIAHMGSQHETYWIDVRYDSPVMAMRVRPFAVYRVLPTLQSTIGNILVIIRMIGMTTVTFSIEAAIVGQQVGEVIKKIVDGYVAIEDPNERKIFEAILKLRSELVVVNYDALHSEDYKNAYGKIDPNADRITEHVAENLSATDAKAALDSLLNKGVVKKSKHGYRFVF
ncbi:hypothetical protein OB2597_06720 [Pseudooceanicola batsensis HTCC2597]|uniref:Uncharacterized protein n=1 Tax=Pseudooceanicola batsensis (strain ATCC BAA-863 / DSM 15984 / KCTC 12145 / HTCC2597) TaxID=252305 RepID=A3TTH9_PSEBH|nr:hypothetical protein [Pseudooceanicola batsensis]EAQ04956.1 hypothetical protein OB2597_06720 [Pseudooceanicola batsensis HTCC2597]